MKSRIIVLALLISAACNRFEPFTFVQMADTQIGFLDDSPAWCHSDSLMKAAVDAANALKPACVIIAGDLVDNPSDPVQDSIFTTRLKEIEAPVYTLPGNHDYQGTEPEKLQRYIALRGYERFSFKDHGCAFISLNSNVIKDNVEDMEQAQLAILADRRRIHLSHQRLNQTEAVSRHCLISKMMIIMMRNSLQRRRAVSRRSMMTMMMNMKRDLQDLRSRNVMRLKMTMMVMRRM